jgi:uncharacterized repeat protein (TIGR03803 family)
VVRRREGNQVCHTFSGHTNGDGANPWAALIEDGAGNLYGTTIDGGANNWGTVFKIAPGGAETVLYNFCSRGKCSDGQLPHDGLIVDKAGNLYGMATYGAMRMVRALSSGWRRTAQRRFCIPSRVLQTTANILTAAC